MSRRLIVGLAPLGIVVFAMMAATAQAAPHWYKNGVKLAEGKPIPVVSWGGAVNLSQRSELGEANCRTVSGGTVENPTGGGAGTGVTWESTFFECKCAGCEEAGKEEGLPLGIYITTQNLPWHDQLAEAHGTPAVERELIGEPFLGTFGTPSAGEVQMTEACETPPGFEPHTVTVAAKFEGQLEPEAINGSKVGLLPSAAKFDGASTGALHSEIAGEGTSEGSVKYEGYNAQELITVKNP